jgi:hypothetical protein
MAIDQRRNKGEKMNHKLKALGILVAALALSAMVVSVASADTALKSTQKNVIVTGEQIEHPGGNVFKTGNGEFSCTSVTGAGTGTSPDSVSPFTFYEGTSHPVLSGCTAKGLGSVTATTKGCDFTVTDRTNVSGHNIVHFICNTGKMFEFHIPSIDCVLKMGPQTPEGGIVYTNTEEENPDVVHGTGTFSGITYTKAKTSTGGAPGVLCNAVGNGVDGQLIGKARIRAYQDNGSSGDLTEETYQFTEGVQLPLTGEDIPTTP